MAIHGLIYKIARYQYYSKGLKCLHVTTGDTFIK
jgi:hypothetical protein